MGYPEAPHLDALVETPKQHFCLRRYTQVEFPTPRWLKFSLRKQLQCQRSNMVGIRKAPEGRHRMRVALLKHGRYSEQVKQERPEWRTEAKCSLLSWPIRQSGINLCMWKVIAAIAMLVGRSVHIFYRDRRKGHDEVIEANETTV
jgi:hypothetical protein